MAGVAEIVRRLRPERLELLAEIRDGYCHWRPGCGILERKGLIYRAEYANGPHAEFTDLGLDVCDYLANQPA